MAGGLYGDIRTYDLQTKQRVGEFSTGTNGMLHGLHVTDAGDVWVTDAVRPVSGTDPGPGGSRYGHADLHPAEPRDPLRQRAGQPASSSR